MELYTISPSYSTERARVGEKTRFSSKNIPNHLFLPTSATPPGYTKSLPWESPASHPALLQFWSRQQLCQSDHALPPRQPYTGFPPHSGRNQAPSSLPQSPAWTVPALLISCSATCYCVPAFFQFKSTTFFLDTGHPRWLFHLPRKLSSATLQLTNSQTFYKSAGMLLPQRGLPWFFSLLVSPVIQPYSTSHSFLSWNFSWFIGIYLLVCSFVWCVFIPY